MPTPTLNAWRNVAVHSGDSLTDGEKATCDQVDATLRQFASDLNVDLAPPVLTGMALALLAVQAIQAAIHGNRPGHPEFARQTVDSIGWLQLMVARRLNGADMPSATWGDDDLCDFLTGTLHPTVDADTARTLAVAVRDALTQRGAYIIST